VIAANVMFLRDRFACMLSDKSVCRQRMCMQCVTRVSMQCSILFGQIMSAFCDGALYSVGVGAACGVTHAGD